MLSPRRAVVLIVGVIVGFVGVAAAIDYLNGDGGTAHAACETPATPDIPDVFADDAQLTLPERLAPLVFLHPKETLLPMAADCYLANASLAWADGPKQQIPSADRGAIDADELREGGYRQGTFSSADYTRPFGGNRDPALTGRRGFFLDVDDAFRGGSESTNAEAFLYTGTPAYFEYRRGQYLAYWFFYGFSAPASQLFSGGVRVKGHEGDWEGVSIQLDAGDRPLTVKYFAHGEKAGRVAWAKVPKIGSHPVVFSAWGSHASYRTGGSPGNLDLTAVGRLWPTWQQLLDVRAQPWYGYGGAWGNAVIVPRSDKTLAGSFGYKLDDGAYTGPLGPSRFKPPTP